ncbi:MAG: hypothetical protein ACYCQI_11340 [Gammaproteobacteria bacterium]
MTRQTVMASRLAMINTESRPLGSVTTECSRAIGDNTISLAHEYFMADLKLKLS